ncbi:hypothetical protein LIER_28285 [Lithospermum erythrorhizon]|uniref:Retrovirus-related Pol polyprotein from transposon TNT 1-94-like beta-barrel domain-containing protein n=1 Tax=Lithospermum erythrorhizon TaxID=34254 RepID=A0AAV3RIV6_LITER
MEEDETIATYNSKMKDIANEFFALGETMNNEKLVRKMTFEPIKTGKKKGIALKANCESEEEGDLAETVSLLAKFFNKTMKRFDKKPYTGGNIDGYIFNGHIVVMTWVVVGTVPGTNPNKYRWIHFHCGKRGHITPYCYKIYGRGKMKFSQPKVQWMRKNAIVSHVVFTSLKATAWIRWYFDNECSKHMTGNKSYLSKIEKVKGDFVTFGGGDKGKIVEKGTLSVEGLPALEDVLLVEGLTTNIINVS